MRTYVKNYSLSHLFEDEINPAIARHFIKARNDYFRVFKSQLGTAFRILRPRNIKTKITQSGIWYHIGEQDIHKDDLIELTNKYKREMANAGREEIKYRTV